MSHSFVRYWGSYFRSAPHAVALATEFEALAERGWDCHLVLESMPEDASWLASFKSLGISLTCLPRPRSKIDLSNIRAVYEFCHRVGIDVFHCDNLHLSPLIGARAAGVPVRIWCKRAMSSHYEHCREPGIKERLALSSRLSVKLSTRVLAVSDPVANELIGFGMDPSKFQVLNNPRPEMASISEPRDAVRTRLGIPHDALVMVTVGRVEQVKGWDVLLQAFQAIAVTMPRVHLLLVGSKEVRGQKDFSNALMEQLACSGVDRRVHFTGHVSEVQAMLGAGDIFVLPSRSEGCCKALLEALEIGLPCVATDVGNAREVLGDGRGRIVPRNDSDELKDCLLNLVMNDGERRKLAAESRIPTSVLDRRAYSVWMADFYESELNKAHVGHHQRSADRTQAGR
jgi:glycosyltransferase involved in cell wall biosynthesis